MEIKPMAGRVLVAENKKDEVSAGGIVLAGASTGDTKRGTVLAVGTGVDSVKVNDVVFLDWSKGTVVKVDDAYRLIIKEEDIFAVLD